MKKLILVLSALLLSNIAMAEISKDDPNTSRHSLAERKAFALAHPGEIELPCGAIVKVDRYAQTAAAVAPANSGVAGAVTPSVQ